MSTTLGVQQWFPPPADPAAELSRHAEEFGFQFVADSEDVKEEPEPEPEHDLVVAEQDHDLDSDAEGEAAAARYGGVITVRGSGCAGGSEDEKLLRLLGGDSADEDDDVDDADDDPEERPGASACSVVLDPLPRGVLRSLSCEGRVSATRAQTEVSGLLRELVEAVAEPPPPPPPAAACALFAAACAAAPHGRKARKRRRRRSASAASTSSSGASSSHGRERRRQRKRERRSALYAAARTTEGGADDRREPSPTPTPRVNPIFVWIKQDDTRIVEVLCEDYDKRNRIRITKTAHGWRAIPHTERLASALSPPAVQKQSLPAGKTQSPPLSRTHSSSSGSSSSGSGRRESSRSSTESRLSPVGGSARIPTVAPAVASLATREERIDISQRIEDEDAESGAETKEGRLEDEDEGAHEEEEDETGTHLAEYDCEEEMEYEEDVAESDAGIEGGDTCCEMEEPEDDHEMASLKAEDADEFCDPECYQEMHQEEETHGGEEEEEEEEEEVQHLDEGEIVEGCEEEGELCQEEEEEEEEEEVLPTDLSLPKLRKREEDEMECKPRRLMLSRSPPITIPKYSPSCGAGVQQVEKQYQEAQPAHQQPPRSAAKSAFLESLLSRKVSAVVPTEAKPASERTSPAAGGGAGAIDLGTRAAAAGSPTVSCSSDEKAERERDDLTLRALLAGGCHQQPVQHPMAAPPPPPPPPAQKHHHHQQHHRHQAAPVAPPPTLPAVTAEQSGRSRLLELLTAEEPVAQLRRLERDFPDPLVVPRDRLPALLAAPAAEAPRLLASRPDLRLPAALSSPALVHDPDLLVVPLRQLYATLQQQQHAKDAPAASAPAPVPDFATLAAFAEWQQRQQVAAAEAATAASLTQVMWLPYLTQLEAASALCGNYAEFVAAVNAVFPPTGFGGGAAAVPPPPPYLLSPTAGVDYKAQLEAIAASFWQQQQHVAPTKSKAPSAAKRSPRASPLSRPQRHHAAPAPQAPPPPPPPAQPAAAANRPPSVTCKSLLNLLSSSGGQRRPEPVALKVPQPPGAGPIDLSATPKLKVKQPQHLVDPLHTPRLLKEPPPECAPIVSSTAVSPGPPPTPDKVSGAQNLWHPLFGSQKSYSSPWQWTTVTATGE
ncbi:bromodomain-containing protein 4 [Schistocerca nitens]|uniref:bromodomain-containing protein 4 n=1 Tax=Schistocerca nitens TaxID=7011 RepID=UPI0021188D8C|nr:bromodomain-containing protein 4 [Schistocerca nitens]